MAQGNAGERVLNNVDCSVSGANSTLAGRHFSFADLRADLRVHQAFGHIKLSAKQLWSTNPFPHEALLPEKYLRKFPSPKFPNRSVHCPKSTQDTHYNMSSNAEYWKRYLEGSNTSIFPSLTDKSLRDVFQHVIPIPIDGALDIATFCKELDIVPLSLLQLSWAIVLRCYLASDGIVFGYREEPRGNCDAEGDFVYRADFNSSDPVAPLLKHSYVSSQLQKEIGPTEVHTYKKSFFNTFLLLRTINDEPLPSSVGDEPRVRILNKFPYPDFTD